MSPSFSFCFRISFHSWHETVKLVIPIDQFKRAHLKFVFRHCSSNSTDKSSSKPFCFSFKKLQEEGRNSETTIKDGDYNLTGSQPTRKNRSEEARMADSLHGVFFSGFRLLLLLA